MAQHQLHALAACASGNARILREEFSEAYDKYAKNFPNGYDDGHTWDHFAVHGKVECLTHARRRGVRRIRLRIGEPNSLCIVAVTKMKKQLDGQIELETMEDAPPGQHLEQLSCDPI